MTKPSIVTVTKSHWALTFGRWSFQAVRLDSPQLAYVVNKAIDGSWYREFQIGTLGFGLVCWS